MLVKISSGPMSITDLYDIVALKMGEEPEKVTNYDCRKILVSKNIFDDVEEWYKINRGPDYKMSFGMEWVCFGPKVNEELPDNSVELEEGFMSFE